MNANAAPAPTLEQLVDALGLDQVLEHLSALCVAKADHLATNWQDKAGADAWTKAASRLEMASMHSAITRVSPPALRTLTLAELTQRVAR